MDKIKDLRVYHKERTTHQDFTFGTNIEGEYYLRRGNPPEIRDYVPEELRSWWYAITPNKDNVRETFERMLEEGYWKLGTGSGNTSLICKDDIPRLYDYYHGNQHK